VSDDTLSDLLRTVRLAPSFDISHGAVVEDATAGT
jgi:hypothetical protein